MAIQVPILFANSLSSGDKTSLLWILAHRGSKCSVCIWIQHQQKKWHYCFPIMTTKDHCGIVGTSKIFNVATPHLSCLRSLARKNFITHLPRRLVVLASQDALEVMGVSEWLTDSWLADLTDLTLVSEDTEDHDDHDGHKSYVAIKSYLFITGDLVITSDLVIKSYIQYT